MFFAKRRVLKSSEIDFGAVGLDRATGRVFSHDGRELELRHQSRQVLRVLAQASGEAVTREALISEVWSGRTVTDDSVAQCIAEIRRVLDDTDKRLVETVPREGYRLVPPEAGPISQPMSVGWIAVLGFLTIVASVLGYGLLRPNAPSQPPVIAVLPFDDFSSPPHQNFLSDAVSENIITSLARFPQFTVIARRSSFSFRGSNLGIPEIADQLGANFVLEGSQQYDGSHVRTTAQLIDAATGVHVWADEFDVPLGEMLTANSRISRKIASAVGAKVVDTAQSRMAEDDVSALMISNAAQSRIMRNFTRESLLQNIREQEQSIKDYPNSAWGHLGQALSLRIGLRYGWIDDEEAPTRERMHNLARRGVELDPNNFLAFHALGRVLMYNGDVDGAISAFRRAVELNPSSSFARNALAQTLSFVGETEAALAQITEIEQIDPLYGHDTHWTKSRIEWQTNKCDKALATFSATPSMPIAANKTLAAIHHCLGDQSRAEKAMIAFLKEIPNWTVSRERSVIASVWTAPGLLDRWLGAMEAAGMPL